ncbi:MAG: non-hydrolyzing UDP-N-acetylglucosamine 2-epimerase [Bacteroidia bacterium]
MIVTIIGARPQFIKAAVVSKALHDIGINEKIIHTGQHYNYKMSDIFWEELNIPKPTLNLNIGSGQHGKQTAEMIRGIEEFVLLHKEKVKAILLYGDTNSTLAGAIVASKLPNVKCIHIEAGLRSFNKNMPEEVNRIMTDHVSDLLFCSSEIGVRQLKKEGITAPIYNVGDVMYDALTIFSERTGKGVEDIDVFINGASNFSLLTLHRPSNTDDLKILQGIITVLGKLNEDFIWLVHPRVKGKLSSLNIPSNLHITPPASYFQMLDLLDKCNRVYTDSGGMQKEAYWKKKQCITLRFETEWVETLKGNWNVLVGNDSERIAEASKQTPISEWIPLYGEGKASTEIANVINDFLK